MTFLKIFSQIVFSTKIIRELLFSSTIISFGYFIYRCYYDYKLILKTVTDDPFISLLVFSFILIVFLGIIKLIPYVIKTLISRDKVLSNLVINFIMNSLISYVMGHATLFSVTFLRLSPDGFGNVINTDYLSIQKKFTLNEKLEWVNIMHDTYLKALPEKFWVEITGNIPWDTINNYYEFNNFILSQLAIINLKLATLINISQTPKTHWYNSLGSFIYEHPYLTCGTIIAVGFVAWMYYDTIATYLIKLGKISVEKLKVMQLQNDAHIKILENQQILGQQLHNIQEIIPTLATKAEQLTAIKKMNLDLTEQFKIIQYLGASNTSIQAAAQQQTVDMVKLLTMLKEQEQVITTLIESAQ